MKRFPFQFKTHAGTVAIIMLLAMASIFTTSAIRVHAQGNQLSLADILIALRSKKVTLTDRNKILTEAIAARGTTFMLTPEIEKELADTGADKALLDSIRQRTQIAKVPPMRPSAPVTKAKVEPQNNGPVVESPVQDVAFYEKRAQDSAAKGDLDAALVDYTKAAEMDGSAVSVLMGRGRIYFAKRSYLLAIADFTKVIKLDPRNAVAFAQRAEANENQGNSAMALDDYKKAFELDPTMDTAKAAVQRLNAEQAKLTQPVAPAPVPVKPAVIPDFVDLGQINESGAVRMAKPLYSPNAVQGGFGGQVIVEIELDTDGNVTKAKAVSGSPFLRQPSEDAARRSKFRPAMVGEKAVKAKARIVYNFVATR